MSVLPWWSLHPAVETVVECSGEPHEIRWSDGMFQIPRHPDPAGERVLASLGGERCQCVDLWDAWERQKEDLRVLTLASRGPGDIIRAIHGNQQALRAGWYGQAPPQVVNRLLTRRTAQLRTGGMPTIAQPMPAVYGGNVRFAMRRSAPMQMLSTGEPDETESLLELGGGLPDRLVATVLATWCERVESHDLGNHGAQLVSALFGRVTLALRNWLGDPNLPIDLEMIGPSETPSLSRNGDSMEIRLPFRWLLDVWAGGLTVVLGRFSLSLVNESDGRQRVIAIRPDLLDIRPVTISLADAQ